MALLLPSNRCRAKKTRCKQERKVHCLHYSVTRLAQSPLPWWWWWLRHCRCLLFGACAKCPPTTRSCCCRMMTIPRVAGPSDWQRVVFAWYSLLLAHVRVVALPWLVAPRAPTPRYRSQVLESTQRCRRWLLGPCSHTRFPMRY